MEIFGEGEPAEYLSADWYAVVRYLATVVVRSPALLKSRGGFGCHGGLWFLLKRRFDSNGEAVCCRTLATRHGSVVVIHSAISPGQSGHPLRRVLDRCLIDPERCARGLEALRSERGFAIGENLQSNSGRNPILRTLGPSRIALFKSPPIAWRNRRFR